MRSPCRPENIHPFASAIDTPLEVPEKMVSCDMRFTVLLFALRVLFMYPQVVLLTKDKPPYVRLPEGSISVYKEYPPDSLEGWHKKNDLYKE